MRHPVYRREKLSMNQQFCRSSNFLLWAFVWDRSKILCRNHSIDHTDAIFQRYIPENKIKIFVPKNQISVTFPKIFFHPSHSTDRLGGKETWCSAHLYDNRLFCNLHFQNKLSYGYIRFEGNGKIPLAVSV